MLYDIKNDNLKFWWEFDELGDRNDFEFVHYPCACGHEEKVLIGNTTRHRNQFDLYQCQFCGTIRFDPYLTDAGVEKYYSETYGKIKRQDIPAERLFGRQKKSAKLVWEKVSPFLKAGDKVLDFGGGAGGKVMEILAQGYEVYLKELDQKYFAYGVEQGLKPYSEGMKFEFIVLSRVLEHVNNPVEFLKYLRDELLARPVGRASLEREQSEQPIASSGERAGASYIYLEVPLIENSRGDYLLNEIHIAHKFYFTNLSLKYICALAGFEVAYESRNLLIITPAHPALDAGSHDMLALSNKVMSEKG